MDVSVLDGHKGDGSMVVLDGADSITPEQALEAHDSALEIYPMTGMSDEQLSLVLTKLDNIEQIHKEYYNEAVQQQWWIIIGIFFIAGMLPIMSFLLGKGGRD